MGSTLNSFLADAKLRLSQPLLDYWFHSSCGSNHFWEISNFEPSNHNFPTFGLKPPGDA